MPQLSAPDDPQSLDRFLAAQDRTYDAALAELRHGRKVGHWIWFVFPQLRGLGQSTTAHFYGIADGDEARRYLAHPVLGPRLAACAEAMMTHPDLDAQTILGPVDAMKLRSSATLFAAVSGGDDIWDRLITRFFDGVSCPRSRTILEARSR